MRGMSKYSSWVSIVKDSEPVVYKECMCRSNHCYNYRDYAICDYHNGKMIKLRICNNFIKNEFNNIEHSAGHRYMFYPNHYIYNKIIEGCIIANTGFTRNDFDRLDRHDRRHKRYVLLPVCIRPYILTNVPLPDALKVAYGRVGEDILKSGFFERVNSTLLEELTILLQYKKYKHQHNLAEKIIGIISRGHLLSDSELFDVLTLIFNLKIQQHEGSCKQ